MIKTHSEDPDVAHAANQALVIINTVLSQLPKADSYDYGGHLLKIGEYGVCERCATPIAEAQAASEAFLQAADDIEDPTVIEHLQLAAELFHHEAQAATVRAEFHNGHGTEQILNVLLGFQHDRGIFDDYTHSHHGGEQ